MILHTPLARTAGVDDNTEQHSPLQSVNKFKSFLLNLRYKTHGQRFIVYCRVMDALAWMSGVLGGLLSSQEFEV